MRLVLNDAMGYIRDKRSLNLQIQVTRSPRVVNLTHAKNEFVVIDDFDDEVEVCKAIKERGIPIFVTSDSLSPSVSHPVQLDFAGD